MAAKSMVPGDGPGLSKETKLKRQCGKPQQLRSKAFQGERNTCDSKGNLWAFGVIGWSAYPRFDSGQKPRQFKSIWIWANRPSSKGSKLLFPVIKANKIIGSRMTIGGQTHFHALGAHTKSLVPGWRSVDKLTFMPWKVLGWRSVGKLTSMPSAPTPNHWFQDDKLPHTHRSRYSYFSISVSLRSKNFPEWHPVKCDWLGTCSNLADSR